MRRLLKIIFYLGLLQTGLIIPYMIWRHFEKKNKPKEITDGYVRV